MAQDDKRKRKRSALSTAGKGPTRPQQAYRGGNSGTRRASQSRVRRTDGGGGLTSMVQTGHNSFSNIPGAAGKQVYGTPPEEQAQRRSQFGGGGALRAFSGQRPDTSGFMRDTQQEREKIRGMIEHGLTTDKVGERLTVGGLQALTSRLNNLGSTAADIHGNRADTYQTGLQADARLAQQGLRNRGALDETLLQNQGDLAQQQLSNQGQMAVQGLANQGRFANTLLSGQNSLNLSDRRADNKISTAQETGISGLREARAKFLDSQASETMASVNYNTLDPRKGFQTTEVPPGASEDQRQLIQQQNEFTRQAQSGFLEELQRNNGDYRATTQAIVEDMDAAQSDLNQVQQLMDQFAQQVPDVQLRNADGEAVTGREAFFAAFPEQRELYENAMTQLKLDEAMLTGAAQMRNSMRVPAFNAQQPAANPQQDVESYAAGGVVGPPAQAAQAPQQNAPPVAQVQNYQKYVEMARQMGLPPVSLEEFMASSAKQAQQPNSPGQNVMGMAQGGPVPPQDGPPQGAALPPEIMAKIATGDATSEQGSALAQLKAAGQPGQPGQVDGQQVVDPSSQGQTDSIPAVIDGQQAAKLDSGEFVLPKDVVMFYGLEKIQKMVEKARGGGASGQGKSEGAANGG